jgi:hypothetical protein
VRTSVLCVGLGVGGTVEVTEKEKKIHVPCGKCLRTFTILVYHCNKQALDVLLSSDMYHQVTCTILYTHNTCLPL